MVSVIFTGIIPPRIQAIALGGSLLVLFLILVLIRGGRLKEGYALVWLSIPIITFVFALFPELLQLLAHLFGVAYAPAAFLLVLVSGLYLLNIHFSLLLHRYDKRIRSLAQEHAILKEEMTHKQNEE